MRSSRWVYERARFLGRSIGQVRRVRTSSLVFGGLLIAIVVVAVIGGRGSWFTLVQAAAGIILVTQGVFADAELNRRESMNAPSPEPDGPADARHSDR